MPKIGVYICHCGLNIAGVVDVEKVTKYAKTLPDVVIVKHYTYMCSEPGQRMIRKDIKNPNVRIWHVIDFLHDFVGLDNVKKAVQKSLKGLKLAMHVGCQIIRYSDLGRVDDAENRRKLDELVRALGPETVDYAEKLDCCGANLMYSHPDSALSLAGTKLSVLQNLGVDGLVVSCPDCGLMFDSKQKDAGTTVGAKLDLPVAYYTQLLGLSLGIEQEKLGLHLNQSSVGQLFSKVSA
jgi:heterodisulfide reductase subunit B